MATFAGTVILWTQLHLWRNEMYLKVKHLKVALASFYNEENLAACAIVDKNDVRKALGQFGLEELDNEAIDKLLEAIADGLGIATNTVIKDVVQNFLNEGEEKTHES